MLRTQSDLKRDSGFSLAWILQVGQMPYADMPPLRQGDHLSFRRRVQAGRCWSVHLWTLQEGIFRPRQCTDDQKAIRRQDQSPTTTRRLTYLCASSWGRGIEAAILMLGSAETSARGEHHLGVEPSGPTLE